MTESEDTHAGLAGTPEAPSAASQLFDLRTIIAVLFGVYGIVLTVQAVFFQDEAQLEKSGGIDINLWSGLAMIVVAALFLVWARLRPLVPPGRRP
jgi:drug/metabolite transporter (DMT)-like permease